MHSENSVLFDVGDKLIDLCLIHDGSVDGHGGGITLSDLGIGCED